MSEWERTGLKPIGARPRPQYGSWSQQQLNDALREMAVREGIRELTQNRQSKNVPNVSSGGGEDVSGDGWSGREMDLAMARLRARQVVERIRMISLVKDRAIAERERRERDAEARKREQQDQAIKYDIQPKDAYLTADGKVHGYSSDGALPSYQIPRQGLFFRSNS